MWLGVAAGGGMSHRGTVRSLPVLYDVSLQQARAEEHKSAAMRVLRAFGKRLRAVAQWDAGAGGGLGAAASGGAPLAGATSAGSLAPSELQALTNSAAAAFVVLNGGS